MKIPAIRAKIGDWTYYITTLTFEQISRHVGKIEDEIYSSDLLKDLLQRSITENFRNIKEYILQQNEFFFNSLVLAVYDDYPKWIEIELLYNDDEHYNVGLLEFPGSHKIIPVDGQHRVEGIKSALKENPKLRDNEIGAIFIGHINTDVGKERTRRLFTTLNRYAKPVSKKDIIALDEDDIVAITTRQLLEDVKHPLFTNGRVIHYHQKAIPDSNKTAFTSIITLYDCNVSLFKQYYKEYNLKNITEDNFKSKSHKDFLRFRPNSDRINSFLAYCVDFWDQFVNKFNQVGEYTELPIEDIPNYNFRNKENGGNLLFRPVGIEPFVDAVTTLRSKSNSSYRDILGRLSRIDFTINQIPWKSVVWNDLEKTMIMGSKNVVKLLLLYMYDDSFLTEKQLQDLKEKYASRLNKEEEIDNILEEIPRIN